MRHWHLARRDLLLACAHKTKLATPQRIPNSYRRPEHPAGHRPPFIDIAKPCLGIQRGAGRIVGKLLKPLLIFLGCAQHSRLRIARKVHPKLLDPILRPLLNHCSPPRIYLPQCLHALPQTRHIQRMNGKRAMTALRTSRPACEPCACPLRRLRQRRIHDLHKLSIIRR